MDIIDYSPRGWKDPPLHPLGLLMMVAYQQGGWMLPEDSCEASLVAKPFQPPALMSIWPLLSSEQQYSCLCGEGMKEGILRQLNSETTDLFSVILKDEG